MSHRILIRLTVALVFVAPALGADPIEVRIPKRANAVSYSSEIADFLDAKCVACHNQALAENKLNMEDITGMIKGGKRGPALVPGNADKSLLFQMAAHRVEPTMPPKAKKDLKPLTSDELGLLKLWIDSGAQDDSAEHEKEKKPLELGSLPAGIHPIVAVDMTAVGTRVAAGRANTVQVYESLSGLEIISLGGHQDIIQSIRYSPDGSKLAAGSYKIVTVWNASIGGLVGSIDGHNGPIKALAISSNRILTGGTEKILRVWGNDPKGASLLPEKAVELATQKPYPADVLAIAASPKGERIATGLADGSIVLSRPDPAKPTVTIKSAGGAIADVAFLSESLLAAASADANVRIWRLPMEGAAVPEPFVLSAHAGPVRAVVADSDGHVLYSAGEDGKVATWHGIDGKLRMIEKLHNGPITSIALSPDSKTLLTGSADRTVRTFDATTLSPGLVLSTQSLAVRSVAFSTSGTRIAAGCETGGIKIWESANGRGVIAFCQTNASGANVAQVNKVGFLTDDTLVSAAEDKSVKLWSFSGVWSDSRTFDDHVFRVLALDFHPDGSLLATGGGEPSRSGEIKIWELNKGFLVRQFDTLHSDTVFGLRFNPDGSRLASAAADKFLKVVSVVGGKELRSFEGHTNHVLAVDWKSDGKQLVTGGADNVLKVWDFDTGEQVRPMNGAGKQVTALRWVAGGNKVVGASGDSNVRLWAAENGNVQRTFSGPTDYVFGVAVSADGKTVAAGGADGVLFIWNGENGQVIRKLEPPASKPKS